MDTDRLSALAMISIASDIISEIKDLDEKVISHFATAKCHRVELLYKQDQKSCTIKF